MVYLEIPNMSEHPIEKGITGVVRTYELMDRVRTRQDLVIRDDQFDFPALLEAARYAGRRRIRMSLLDTGRFGLEDVDRSPGRGPHPGLRRRPAAPRGRSAGGLPGAGTTFPSSGTALSPRPAPLPA
jgi:hypothetical protein